MSLPFAGIEFDTKELLCSLSRGLNLKPPWESSQQANGIWLFLFMPIKYYSITLYCCRIHPAWSDKLVLSIFPRLHGNEELCCFYPVQVKNGLSMMVALNHIGTSFNNVFFKYFVGEKLLLVLWWNNNNNKNRYNSH